MSAGIARVHGQAAAGAFYGYSPVVVKILNTGTFTADSVDGTTGAITEGGYSKAVKAVQTVGSIVWLGAQNANTFTAIVDYPSLNQGDGAGGNAGATTGFGALKAALVAAGVDNTTTDFVITSSTVLNGDGTFTFA